MASKLTIWNRALQLLGARRVDSLDDTTVSGRACRNCYDTLLDLELEKHPWGFAIKRAQLAADADEPSFGRANFFTLPSDYLRLLRPDPEQNGLEVDYVIEENRIASNLGAPLNIRYVARITDPNRMPALFREALSHSMAVAMCEELTQSRGKKNDLIGEYDRVIKDARKHNAFVRVAQIPPEDEWVTVRSMGTNLGPWREYES